MQPTYLYIKQHTITEKLYFGKTIQNPETYKGSGKHWKRHIEKHGTEYVINLWYHLFIDETDLYSFALEFSNKMNIVKSTQWLNLIPENGLTGGNTWIYMSSEQRALQRIKSSNSGKANKGNKRLDLSARNKILIPLKNSSWYNDGNQSYMLQNDDYKITNLNKGRLGESPKKGKPQPIIKCPHCDKSGGLTMYRWHFDNCKFRTQIYHVG